MKILKVTLIVLVIIIGLLLIIGLLSKKEMSAKVTIEINQPKEMVFDYVKYLRNQENYSKWATMDENQVNTFTGTDGTVGFISAWSGEEVGIGEQEIVAIEEGKRIDYELRFKEPFESTSLAFISLEAVDDSKTKVAWGFSGKLPYPINLMLLFFDMEGEIARDYEYGLEKLKGILESMERPMEEDEVMEEEAVETE